MKQRWTLISIGGNISEKWFARLYFIAFATTILALGPSWANKLRRMIERRLARKLMEREALIDEFFEGHKMKIKRTIFGGIKFRKAENG